MHQDNSCGGGLPESTKYPWRPSPFYVTWNCIYTFPVDITLETSLPDGFAMAFGLSRRVVKLSLSTLYPKYSQIDPCYTGEYILITFLCMPGWIGMTAEP